MPNQKKWNPVAIVLKQPPTSIHNLFYKGSVGRAPIACGVGPPDMVKGRKRGTAHVDEPSIGNVVILKIAASNCFDDMKI